MVWHLAERIELHGLCLEAHAIEFKKKRDPVRLKQAQPNIAKLIKQEEACENELTYLDVAIRLFTTNAESFSLDEMLHC